MRISVQEACMINDKYEGEVPIIYLTDVRIKGEPDFITIPKETPFDPSQYELLEKASIHDIDVHYNEKLYAKLVSNFPVIYRAPIGRKNVIEMDRFIDELESSNTASKRKRCIISLCEIYKRSSWGVDEPVINYGEKLDHKRWNDTKVNIGRNVQIDYRYDECGIIVFFILQASDPNYSQKFMKFTELVSLIVDSKRLGVIFNPDFIPETDVYCQNSKNDLLKMYIETGASLIIAGEDLDNQYKEALSQVKLYDKFARMMVIKNPEASKRIEILMQIKSVYSSRLWEQ